MSYLSQSTPANSEPEPSAELETAVTSPPALWPSGAPNRTLLNSVWTRQTVYSDNATRAQKRFLRIRFWRIVLNISVIFLAIFHAESKRITAQIQEHIASGTLASSDYDWLDRAWRWAFAPATLETAVKHPLWQSGTQVTGFLLILLPIVITALLSYAVKFDRGMNWLLLRGNAETLKMEIFYYRTRVGEYQTNRDTVLARKLKLISERIKGSTVHQAALSPYEGQSASGMKKAGLFSLVFGWIRRKSGQLFCAIRDFLWGTPNAPSANSKDDKYSDLNPAKYLEIRLNTQFDWYRKKALVYDRQLQIYQSCIYISGGIGTLLAALGFQSWVAIATAFIGAFTTYLEFKRVEATLVGYNQAADALYDVRAWWLSLTPQEQGNPENVTLLVKSTEETIRSEHLSWLQDMQDKLAQLYGQEGKGEEQAASPAKAPAPAPPAAPLPPLSPEAIAADVLSPDMPGLTPSQVGH